MYPEQIFPFVIVLTLVSAGFFLLLARMILSHLKDRRKGTGASLGTSELEAIVQRAVESGTASLHDRLDQLEHRIEAVDEKVAVPPKALPEAQPLLDEVIEPAEVLDVHESRRAVSRQKA